MHRVGIFIDCLKTFPQDSDDVGGLAHRVEVNTGNSVSQKVFALSGGPFLTYLIDRLSVVLVGGDLACEFERNVY